MKPEPQMVYPCPMYAGMPARVRWRLAWRCARVLSSPDRASIHAAAASVSLVVVMEYMDAERLVRGKPTVLQALKAAQAQRATRAAAAGEVLQ